MSPGLCTAAGCVRIAQHHGLCDDHDVTQARATRPRMDDVVLCATAGCPRAAFHGPHCSEHKGVTRSDLDLRSFDLTDEGIGRLQAEVARDAAPLFLLALNWIWAERCKGILQELEP